MDSKKLWLGAAEAGLGIGIIGAILRSLREAERAKVVENNPDEMVLRLGPPPAQDPLKQAGHEKAAFLTKLLIAAGITTGTAYAVQSLLNRVEEKRLQKEVDEANEHYTQGLGDMKVAAAADGNSSSVLRFLMRYPLEFSLLSMLGGGAAAYAALNNAFPKATPDITGPRRPKRVVIEGYGTLTPDEKADGPLVDTTQKAASFTVDESDQAKASALLFYTLAELSKEAGESCYLHSLACSPSLSEAMAEMGSSALAHCPDYLGEWSSLSDQEKFEKAAAAITNPITGPTVNVVMQAELMGREPEIAKAAAFMAEHEELSPLIVKLASEVAQQQWNAFD